MYVWVRNDSGTELHASIHNVDLFWNGVSFMLKFHMSSFAIRRCTVGSHVIFKYNRKARPTSKKGEMLNMWPTRSNQGLHYAKSCTSNGGTCRLCLRAGDCLVPIFAEDETSKQLLSRILDCCPITRTVNCVYLQLVCP
ncbi:hypothetical protein E2986_12365 [Frieseomelitta varia]|uniref:Uncharacterized protein n=1 Tax=Frieseomelitta varia TaxID=561572 RepID=A0A833VVD1_9HYME|nr:hypothetical protein E2986_12365 [Frieseomelitta varia]